MHVIASFTKQPYTDERVINKNHPSARWKKVRYLVNVIGIFGLSGRYATSPSIISSCSFFQVP